MVLVRGLISFVAAAVAVILQLTIVGRMAFPGGTGPDLVLLVVAALALASGPMIGMLTGFWGGLALDVAPPGSHFVGQNALVFCLIGYACGLAADVPNSEGVPEQGHTALFEIMVTAVGAVCGEALASLLGVMLSDPRVTWSAVRHVLPVAAAYDVLLCPFVLYAAAAALRLAGAPRSERNRAAWAMPAVRGAADRAPGLAQNTPRLKLGSSGSLGGGAKVKFAARRGEGMLGGTWGGLGGASRAVPSSLARSRLDGSRFGPSRMGRSLLGGSVFSRSPSALRALAPPQKTASAAFGRSLTTRRTASLMRSAPGGSASGYSPRARRTGLSARLVGVLTGSARRQPRLRARQTASRPPIRTKSPGRGWLRGSSPRGGTLDRDWAGRRTPRLHMKRPKAKKRWRTGGYR
jgi:rod shape-determining protein MreD